MYWLFNWWVWQGKLWLLSWKVHSHQSLVFVCSWPTCDVVTSAVLGYHFNKIMKKEFSGNRGHLNLYHRHVCEVCWTGVQLPSHGSRKDLQCFFFAFGFCCQKDLLSLWESHLKICIGNSMICSDIWHKYHEW